MVIPQYDRAVPVEKFTVSFEVELARLVRELAEAEGRSVSGWLADAARRKLRREAAKAALAAYETEFGPITDDELEDVDKLWPPG